MIRRLYVDNFRSLVDFTWEPGKETLVLGYNGSGKTSALEVIRVLQGLCARPFQDELGLRPDDRTSWSHAPAIHFELDIEIAGDKYAYSLHVGFQESQRPEIIIEALDLNGRRLFNRMGQGAQIAGLEGGLGSRFPISASLSVVEMVGAEMGGEAIVPFREYLGSVLYLKPLPSAIQMYGKRTVNLPEATLGDLVSWYRHLAKDAAFEEAFTSLFKGTWPELVDVSTPKLSPNVHDFVARVRGGPKGKSYTHVPLRAMSDGEKMLVGLYTVAAYQRTHPPTTIIVDEPDNYVSLLEIQPWLLTMLDTCPDDGQLILVSHNEEIIQTMGRENVAYFSRKDHVSPTRVRGIREEETEVAPIRDLLRRGWLDE